MDLPTKLRLVRCATGGQELAEIVTLTREDAKSLINHAWWDNLTETITDPSKEPDRHWDWRMIVSAYQNKPYFKSLCAQTEDRQIQAAMVIRVDALSVLEPGQRAVYVDRLATSPWNRDKLMKEPRFNGAGSGLLLFAVAMSYSLGFFGRVNLAAIASEDFYRKQGFVPTSTIIEDDVVYELPSAVALAKLKSRGLIDDC